MTGGICYENFFAPDLIPLSGQGNADLTSDARTDLVDAEVYGLWGSICFHKALMSGLLGHGGGFGSPHNGIRTACSSYRMTGSANVGHHGT